MENLKIKHDDDNQRFYAEVNGGKAELDYIPHGHKYIDFISTFVPQESRHEGVGHSLAEHALEYAANHDLRVKPTCPFVRDVMDHNPGYRKLAYNFI
ncbi:MAG: GNAT family N-acetyltransferase [Marinoscillum sp.]